MINSQLEVVRLVSEERRNRLLAEVAQMRLLKASQANLKEPTGITVWLRWQLTKVRRWLTQSLPN